MTTLELTRRGSFQIEHTGDDSTQCGIRGTRKLSYRVVVECADTAIDGNGFIVDQLDIDRFMQDKHKSLSRFPSCEEMAMAAAREIRHMCRDLIRVSVTVGASKDAFMTATIRER